MGRILSPEEQITGCIKEAIDPPDWSTLCSQPERDIVADPYLILHIGLPKTGTTFLQADVFPGIPSIRFIHQPRGDTLRGLVDARYGLLDRCFKHSAFLWREHGDAVLASILGSSGGRQRPDRSVLISDEGISTAGRRPEHLRCHLQEFGRTVQQWGFAGLRVICTVRRQDQWLGSHYAQLSDRFRGASQRGFEAFVAEFIDPATGYYRDGLLLDYQTLVDQLAEGVGGDNVLILPFEHIAGDWTRFHRALVEFVAGPSAAGATLPGTAGHKRNARSSTEDTWRLRKSAPVETFLLRPQGLFRLLGLPGAVPLRLPDPRRERCIRMTEALRARILARYADANRAMALTTGLDLERYGYFDSVNSRSGARNPQGTVAVR
jgi:hypothetical protein